MAPATIILVTLVVYKVVLVAIAILAERRTRDGADFFLAGRGLGPLVAAISASASSSSAWTLLGVSGAAYRDGLAALWLFPACVGGFLLNWVVLAPALQRESRRIGAITVTDVLAGTGARRSRAVATLASLIVLVSLGAYVASQYQAAGKTFQATFDLRMDLSILIGAGVVIFYTLIGGFWAVSLTDTLQGLVMAAVSVVLPIAALIEVGGPSALVAALRDVAQPGYASLGGPGSTSLAIGFVLGFLGIGLGYPGQPHVVNRFMALREGPAPMHAARRISILWAVVVYAGMLLLGFCGRALYPTLADGENIFVVTTTGVFHPAVAGVMLAAILSAIMSTADSQLLVAASAVTHDLGLGGDNERGMLRNSRVTVLVLGVLAVVGALYATKEIFSNVLFAWSAMGAAFGPLLLVRVVMRRDLTARAVFGVMALGFATSVTAYALTKPGGVLPSELRLLLSGVVPFTLAFLAARLLSSRPPSVDSARATPTSGPPR